jgi:hypothetical protein
VALNLAVAVVAAVNAALASHLSLRPEQNAPNIEARLILCMIALFDTVVISGGSLMLLSANINILFSVCVGVLFLSGVVISTYHVSEIFGSHWLKRMYKTPLSTSSLILSSLTLILALAQPDATIWFTIPNYYFVLTYQSLVDIQNMPSRSGISLPSSFVPSGRCLRWRPIPIKLGTCGIRLPLVSYQV